MTKLIAPQYHTPGICRLMTEKMAIEFGQNFQCICIIHQQLTKGTVFVAQETGRPQPRSAEIFEFSDKVPKTADSCWVICTRGVAGRKTHGYHHEHGSRRKGHQRCKPSLKAGSTAYVGAQLV
ncbi:MAG: hypothetical protein LJE64_14525 [Desulfofustis sp.]|nr:hypothetical protein [Desulfofustis sp.]